MGILDPIIEEHRVPAGALALVLVIGIVISAMLLGLVGYYASSHQLVRLQERQLRVQRNARSGMAYALASPDMPYFRAQKVDLFATTTDSVRITRQPWGLFDLVSVVAHEGSLRDTLTALVGSCFNTAAQAALYLPSTEPYPLALVGGSQLVGPAYLPPQGARATYLPGHSTPTPQPLVKGSLYKSDQNLPLDTDSAFQCLHDYATHTLANWLPANALITQAQPAGYYSFSGSPVVWQPSRLGPKTRLRVRGNVLVISTEPIVLDSLSQVEDILIMAPKITLAKGFQGRLQLFARDTVIIEDRARLLYPSAIGVYSTTGSPAILLGAYVSVAGIIASGAPATAPAYPIIAMQPTTHIIGQVSTTGTVLNCGQVTGTVMCRQLAYQFSPRDSRYNNYLVDAVINRTGLSADFLTSPWLNPGAPRGIIRWVTSQP